MKTIFTLFSLLCVSLSLKAQITITSANMPVVGDTCRYSSAVLSSMGNYTATGVNYTWDFSTLDSTGQGMRKFVSSTTTPYAFYFFSPKYGEKTADSIPIPAIPTTTLNLTMKNIYSFYKKNGTSSFNAEGTGVSIMNIPIGSTAPNSSSEDKLYLFPLNYGNRDSTGFKFSTPSFTVVPFLYKKQGYRITEVDGWGTITTPYGTEQCLRVVTTQYSEDTITINQLPAGFNTFGFPNYVRSYQWLTLTEKIPYLEVSGSVIFGAFVPTQARYRDRIRYNFVGVKETEQSLALSVFPNPANTELTLIIPQNSNTVVAEITDLQGKLVQSKSFERNSGMVNEHKIDVSALAKGLYMLNLTSGSQKQALKISIQ
jgi:hypothetical protein